MRLKEDLAILRPTFLPSVPRLFNRFYDGMQAKVKELTGLKRVLADRAIASKLYYLENGGHTNHKVYDRLVFNKFKDVVGGRVEKMVTGSAPISKDILNFLKIAFCCPIYEGYGQTETCAAATITGFGDSETGHVGGPVRSIELKLVDVPEMKYTSKD
jgi:long-chain acyl-CoA synthetase